MGTWALYSDSSPLFKDLGNTKPKVRGQKAEHAKTYPVTRPHPSSTWSQIESAIQASRPGTQGKSGRRHRMAPEQQHNDFIPPPHVDHFPIRMKPSASVSTLGLNPSHRCLP